jgi:hypothetical protein
MEKAIIGFSLDGDFACISELDRVADETSAGDIRRDPPRLVARVQLGRAALALNGT